MKKFSLFLFSLAIGTIIFIWIFRMIGWQKIGNSFLLFTGWQGMIILILSFLTTLIGAWKWAEILKQTGAKVPFRDVWKAYLAGFSIRFLAPIIIAGGEFFQGYILKKKNSVPWSQGMASVIIDRILEWTVNLVMVFWGGIFFLLIIGFPPVKLMIIFGSVFLIFLSVLSFFYFKVFKRESVIRIFSRLFSRKINLNNNNPFEIEKNIFNFFGPKKATMWRILGLNFMRAGVLLLKTWLLVVFLGKSITVFSSFSILGFTYLAIAIPIPAALGSHELLQTFAFNSFNLGIATAAAFTMIIRGAELVVAFIGIIVLFRLGIFLIKDEIFDRLGFNKTGKMNYSNENWH